MENKKEWFELRNITLQTKEFNNFESLKKDLSIAKKIEKDSWSLNYIKVNAQLVFNGKLNTPNGEISTEYVYYIETDLDKFQKEARIDIYEQTLNKLDYAVTIKFSSGSIISKIVFGDIEKAYIKLKEEIKILITKYNEEVEKFNQEIKELKDKQQKEEK